MSLYICYNDSFNDNTFKMWLNHYNRIGIEFKVFVIDKDLDLFSKLYPLTVSKIIDYIPDSKKYFEITVNDFLFTYDHDDNDNIILNCNFDVNFIHESICIGKVFYVPIKDKPIYTTFEIPDFILYKHSNHTNYTIDGIKINGGNKISEDIVCLSLLESKVKEYKCYLECFNLYGVPKSNNIYDSFLRNFIINKEHKYGIIWYPKSACTSIGTIFCNVNNINIHQNNKKNLTFYRPKYRFNPYLQGINFITFTRNPYHRFLSSYIDKHIFRQDLMYLNIDGYKKFVENNKNIIYYLAQYITRGNYITDHYLPTTMFDCYKFIVNDIKNTTHNNPHKLTIFKIEDGLNTILYNFLSKYHENINKFGLLKVFDNSIINKINNSKRSEKHLENSNNLVISNKLLQFYDTNKWEEYLKHNKLNYDEILTDELKEILYNFYIEDFITFGYLK